MDLSSLAGWCRLITCFLLILIVYPYLIYPTILWFISRFGRRTWMEEEFAPTVSVLIAAHNEESVIRAKIENSLALDYPEELLEIIVVSDCSCDGTDAIVESYAPRAKLVRLHDRSGKQIALNRAVEASTGAILLFTDASVHLTPSVAARMTRHFIDPRIGAVSSVIKITREGPDRFPVAEESTSTDAEGAYLGLDLTTRMLESHLYSAVGCAGSCYAVRRACFSPFAPADCNDFASALDAVRLGYRVVVDPKAVGYMLPARTIEGEFRRKARTIAGGLGTLADQHHWPSMKGHLAFWWCLFSHKIARWIGPIALVLTIGVSLIGALAGDPWLMAFFFLAAGGFAVGTAAMYLPILRALAPFRMAAFGAVSCLAALQGWRLFITGNLPVTWKPTERVDEPAPAPSAS